MCNLAYFFYNRNTISWHDMKIRLFTSSLLISVVFICTYFGLGLTENRAEPYDFGRKVNESIKLVDVLQNDGYGKIIGISLDSIIFLDNLYNRVVVSKIAGGHRTLDLRKNERNGKYFFLGGGALTSQGVFSFCGNCSEVYFNGKKSDRLITLTTSFTHGVFIDDESMILRTGNLKYEFVLGKYNLKNHHVNWSNMNTSMKNNGGLATDGSLVYDGKRFLYFVNRYNSSILKFDSNLQVKSVFHTLDGVKALPKVVYLQKSKSFHFAGIRNAINERAAAFGDSLFVVSAAKGKRDPFSFTNYIDIYNGETGKYLFSYSIPRKFGEILDIYADSTGSVYLLTPKHLKRIQLI